MLFGITFSDRDRKGEGRKVKAEGKMERGVKNENEGGQRKREREKEWEGEGRRKEGERGVGERTEFPQLTSPFQCDGVRAQNYAMHVAKQCILQVNQFIILRTNFLSNKKKT